MKKKINYAGKKKTSFWLPEAYIQAMKIIKNEERMQLSHQIELAMLNYFNQYRHLLEKNSVDVWKNKQG